MKLFHTTLCSNFDSIIRLGILREYSKGVKKVVWLHTEEKMSWAFLHVVRRHGGAVQDVVSFEVVADKKDIRKSSVPGLFYCVTDISPSALVNTIGFAVISRSPLEETA